MTDQPGLESRYQEARSALKARDYNRASGLLRQILQIDENYKDASRLLAQTVKMRRRRWYNHPVLWWTIGIIAAISLLAWLPSELTLVKNTPSLEPKTITVPPHTPLPTTATFPTGTSTLTPIPLAWKRISLVQEYQRDEIRVLAVDPRDSETLFLGTENSGLYKSINGGLSFQPIQQGLGHASAYTLAIDPVNSQIVFAGFLPGVLYRSLDGGNSWNQLNIHNHTEIGCGSNVIIDPNNSQHVLWVGGCQAIYESFDSGDNWSVLQDSHCPAVISAISFDPIDSQHLYAAQSDSFDGLCDRGIYESTNGGHTFTRIETASRNIRPHRFAVGRGANGSTYIFASSYMIQNQQSGTIISRDGGKTWIYSEDQCFSFQIRHDGSMAGLCGNNLLLATYDGGAHWDQITSYPRQGNSSPHLAIAHGNPDVFYLAEAGLLISSESGKPWQESKNGLPANRMDLRLHQKNLYLLQPWRSVDTPLNFSRDAGIHWETITDKGFATALDADGETIYRLSRDILYHQENRTGKWLEIPIPGSRPQEIASHPSIPDDLFLFDWNDEDGHTVNLYHTQDNGKSWDKTLIPRQGGSYEYPIIHFSPSDDKTMYISSSNAQPVRSIDGGANWTQCTFTQAYSGFSMSETRLAIHPEDGNTLYLASTGYGIFKSSDGCNSWTMINTGLDSLSVNTLAIDRNHPEVVYAGTSSGAYISTNNGETWNEINDGLLGATVVYSIVVDKDGNVYAATPYGIFKLEGR